MCTRRTSITKQSKHRCVGDKASHKQHTISSVAISTTLDLPVDHILDAISIGRIQIQSKAYDATDIQTCNDKVEQAHSHTAAVLLTPPPCDSPI